MKSTRRCSWDYFSRFDAQPLEFLGMIFGSIDVSLYKVSLFKERIRYFNGLKSDKRLGNIILVLERFIEVYSRLLKEAFYEENAEISSLMSSLALSDRLFYLEFSESSLDNHSPDMLCSKLNVATHVMRHINPFEEKLKHVYDYISFSPFKSATYGDPLLLQEELPSSWNISDTVPYDRHLSIWKLRVQSYLRVSSHDYML